MTTNTALAVVSGAGTGIGREIALALAGEGMRLALLGRRREPLERVLAACPPGGAVFPCDVRSPREVETTSSAILTSLGEPAVLVPAAGLASVGSVEETEPEEFARLVETNLTGAFLLIRAFLPALRRQPRAWIVPVLSVAARRGFAGWGAYCAAKWGVRGLIAALREELVGSRVAVTALYPGATSTDLWHRVAGEWPREAMIPAGDVAAAVRWALSLSPATVVTEIELSPAGGSL